MKVLSISVAAYNVEAFIRECLDSFVESGVIQDVEVIVTDDGSKDSTPDIVSEYSLKYPGSILLVRQPNAGPGSTVNSGIKHATGKYFRMVDGDDWVNPADFAKLVQHLKTCDADAVVNHHIMVDNKTRKQIPCRVEGLEDGKVYPIGEIASKMDIQMHNFIVKTEIMKEHVTLFNCFYTDMQYLVFPTGYLNSVAFFDLSIYMYRISLETQSMNPKSLQKNIAMHESVTQSLIDYYKEYRASDRYQKPVGDYIVSRIVRMAACQFSTYLSFSYNKERKAKFYSFLQEIKTSCPEAVEGVYRVKKVWVLTKVPFLYPVICAIYRKKIGL